MSNQNLVTGKPIPADVLAALRLPVAGRLPAAVRVTTPLEVTPYDALYYFLRVEPTRRLRDQSFRGGPFARQTLDVWYRVRVNGTPGSTRLREELEFLEGIGLAMPLRDTVTAAGAVDYAVVEAGLRELYNEDNPVWPGDGVFINVNENRATKARKFMELLLTYVLPGMYWRNYHVTNGLAPDLELTSHLGREMLEIEELWNNLAAKFGWPMEG